MKLIQWGNSKLSSMLMFNIPASKEICGRVCTGCYSYKFYKIYPNVLPAQQKRYSASLQLDFVDRVCREIKATRKPVKYFRIHGTAGEFYSQEYIDKWEQITKNNPSVIFYAYTKQKRKFNFDGLMALSNFVLIDSLQYRRVNYGKKENAPKGAFICPEQKGSDTICGQTCTYCMTPTASVSAPYFVQH